MALRILVLIFLSGCSFTFLNNREYKLTIAEHFYEDALKNYEEKNYETTIYLCDNALKNLLLAKKENFSKEESSYYNELLNNILRLRLKASRSSSKKIEKKEDFPITFNSRIEKWLKYYTGRGKKYLERWIERSKYYIGIFKEKLRSFGLPEELAYVPIVESGSHPFAISPKKAVGLWQFILPTGKKYGLERNTWYDERRDPEKSTIAACKLLKELYDEFGDWYLALAAYNAGKYKIKKAIRDQKTRNFWELYLPKETEEYVAKIIAVIIIMNDPVVYGFENELSPYEYEEVSVFGPVDLKLVSKLTGVEMKELLFLNPELTKECTPPDIIPYPLKLPKGKGALFVEKFSKIPKEKRYLSHRELQRRKHNVIIHRVRYGENLWKIAKRYRVSVRKIKRWNRLRSSLIYPGQKLKIYR